MDLRKGRARKTFGIALGLTIAVTAAATVGAFFGRLSWFLELLTHFRPQYLMVQVLAAAALGLLRRPGLALLAAACAVPNAVVVAPYLPGLWRPEAAVADAAGGTYSLVAANIRYTSEDAAAVRAYVERRQPDILLLTEFTPRWRKALMDLDRLYPHSIILPRTNPWGMALFSRHPLREFEDLELGDATAVNLRAVVDLPAGPMEIWAVHLASPGRPGRAALRDTQLRSLAGRLGEPGPGDMPRVVVGDMNITAFSPLFVDFLAATGLRDARQPFGLQVTWPALPVPLGIAIDHFLAGDSVAVHRVAAGPAIGSDHFPVEVDFALR